MKPSVLVAAPTYAGKGYALDAYLAAYSALDYPSKELLLIDTTVGSESYFMRLDFLGVKVGRLEPHDHFGTTHFCALRSIYNYAVERGFGFILSLEQDVIVPPKALRKMMRKMLADDLCVLIHTYPPRESSGWEGAMAEMGCTLMRTHDMGMALDYVESQYPVGLNFSQVLEQVADKSAIVRDLFKAQHLDGPDTPWLFTDADPRPAPQESHA